MNRKEKENVKAILDSKDVLDSIPSDFDFGYCPVSSASKKSFVISNVTAGVVKFMIRKSEDNPFELSHESGVLAVKGKQEITISYTPKESESITSTIVLSINGEEKPIKLSAVSKYPLITVTETTLDFKELLVGKFETKEISIQNVGLVPATFKIEKEKNEEDDTSFALSVKKGQIQPGESCTVSFKFQPKLVGVCSKAHYLVKSKGGNFIKVSSLGTGVGYDVHLSAKSMNFGEVSLGNSTNRIVNVVNNSDLATSFSFVVDHKNVFSYSITEGVVAAKASTRVIITFTPKDTVNYYERVFCLIRNHKILHLDLIGTCYDDTTKPLPLLQRHVDAFREKGMIPEGTPAVTKGRGDDNEFATTHLEDKESRLGTAVVEQDTTSFFHKEMFLENDSPLRDVTLNYQFIDFNY